MIELKLDKIDRGSESESKSSVDLGKFSTNPIEINQSVPALDVE